MICYRCNCETGHEQICPICEADLRMFYKIQRLSNMYYNDGLRMAEVRNLSGAIISLKKSLKFNKYNIDARNLLGLVYYEMGEVVDALSEWVISQSYKQEDNVATRYLEAIHENRAQLEAINQTIKKYNQALLYCKQDSRDMAIIQLKKVLSLNPKLVKAHQLLALLYLQEDKLEQAKKSLRSAGKIDANNTTTLRYLKEVNTKLREKGGNRKKKEDDLISYQSGNEMIIMPSRFQDYSLGSTLLYILIGLLIGALATGFLIVPGIQSKAKHDSKEQMLETNDKLSANADIIEAQTKQISELEAQIKVLQGQAGAMPAQIKAYESLLSAYVAFIGQDYLLAGTNLEAIDSTQLSATAMGTYNTLMSAVAEPYNKALYDAGYQSYTSENYADAIAKLLPIVKKDPTYRDGYATYYLAQSYRKNGNVEEAKQYYQYIIDNYPGTERANTAKNYVN